MEISHIPISGSMELKKSAWKPKRYGEKYATSADFLWISHPFHRANLFTQLAHFSGADGAVRSQDGYVARRLWQCWGG